MVNRLYGHALEQNGFAVVQVGTGEAAIEAALGQPFDIAVIDLRLPGKLDGLTTYRVLKAIHPNIKGIIITGYGNRQLLIEALRLGVDGWLEKPVTVTDLVEAVRRAMLSETRDFQQHGWHPPSPSDKSALLKLFLQMLMATTVSNVGILWLVDPDEQYIRPQIVLGEKIPSIPPSNAPITMKSLPIPCILTKINGTTNTHHLTRLRICSEIQRVFAGGDVFVVAVVCFVVALGALVLLVEPLPLTDHQHPRQVSSDR